MTFELWQIRILVDVLARTDALFQPMRFELGAFKRLSAGAVWERQEEFSSRGIDYTVGGDQAARKAGERQLGALASAGLLQIFSPAGRRCGVRLTDRGDDIARTLTAMPLANEAWPLLKAIAGQHQPCMEVYLLGPRDDYGQPGIGKKLAELHMRLLPLLVRGLVRCNSDLQMHVGVVLTSRGCTASKQAAPVVGELPEYDPAAGDAYDVANKEALADRDRWESRCVVIPLSAGAWPERRVPRKPKRGTAKQ